MSLRGWQQGISTKKLLFSGTVRTASFHWWFYVFVWGKHIPQNFISLTNPSKNGSECCKCLQHLSSYYKGHEEIKGNYYILYCADSVFFHSSLLPWLRCILLQRSMSNSCFDVQHETALWHWEQTLEHPSTVLDSDFHYCCSPLKHECMEYDYGISGSLGTCHIKASADGGGVV